MIRQDKGCVQSYGVSVCPQGVPENKSKKREKAPAKRKF